MPGDVTFYIGGSRVNSAKEFVGKIESSIYDGVENWLIEIVDELHENTGSIWPYDTGRSSLGFEIIKKDAEEYHFENEEDYAVALEERGGYIVRLLDERDAKLEEAMEAAVGRL